MPALAFAIVMAMFVVVLATTAAVVVAAKVAVVDTYRPSVATSVSAVSVSRSVSPIDVSDSRNESSVEKRVVGIIPAVIATLHILIGVQPAMRIVIISSKRFTTGASIRIMPDLVGLSFASQ